MNTPSFNSDMNTTAAGVATRAHDALDSAIDKAAPAVNRMVDKAHATIDRVAQSAVPAAEKVQSAMHKANDTSVKLAEACATSVRERPLTALASAAAIGYILGRVMR
jgi:ElaB/YqjD/DUF883 family membrane-anchored ribosome-binding protein